jgi:hypothetical protein
MDDNGYYHHDGPMDLDTFEDCAAAIGRNAGPALLFDLRYRGDLQLRNAPGVVASAWCAAEYPEGLIDPRELWVELFTEAGYTHDGYPAPRPPAPVELFRGCTEGRQDGMAWTSDLEVARRFATGLRARQPGHVYTATVDPEFLLAFIHTQHGRGEAEYVVSPEGLTDVRFLE